MLLSIPSSLSLFEYLLFSFIFGDKISSIENENKILIEKAFPIFLFSCLYFSTFSFLSLFLQVLLTLLLHLPLQCFLNYSRSLTFSTMCCFFVFSFFLPSFAYFLLTFFVNVLSVLLSHPFYLLIVTSTCFCSLLFVHSLFPFSFFLPSFFRAFFILSLSLSLVL